MHGFRLMPVICRRSGKGPGPFEGGNSGYHPGTRLHLKVVGYGLGAIGPGIGIGIACYGCCVATARQPELQGRLFTNFIIGAALAEALALIGFVLTFIL